MALRTRWGEDILSYAEYACSKNFWPSVSADGPPDAIYVCVFPSSVMFNGAYRFGGTMYLHDARQLPHPPLDHLRAGGGKQGTHWSAVMLKSRLPRPISSVGRSVVE